MNTSASRIVPVSSARSISSPDALEPVPRITEIDRTLGAQPPLRLVDLHGVRSENPTPVAGSPRCPWPRQRRRPAALRWSPPPTPRSAPCRPRDWAWATPADDRPAAGYQEPGHYVPTPAKHGQCCRHSPVAPHQCGVSQIRLRICGSFWPSAAYVTPGLTPGSSSRGARHQGGDRRSPLQVIAPCRQPKCPRIFISVFVRHHISAKPWTSGTGLFRQFKGLGADRPHEVEGARHQDRIVLPLSVCRQAGEGRDRIIHHCCRHPLGQRRRQ